jgi:hypothetical protein
MYKHNWFKWSYNSTEYSQKPSPNTVATIEISDSIIVHNSFKHELIETIKYLEPVCKGILFTGYPVNYAIIKLSKELGIPLTVYIPKFSNINLGHCTRAVNICEREGFSYKIVDLDLEKFFENDAESIFKRCYALDVKKLPLVGMLEKIDDAILCTFREPYIIRNTIYDDKSAKWSLKMTEDDLTIPSYFHSSNNIFTDFFFYRKETVVSYIHSPQIQMLINNNRRGLSSSVSVKLDIFEELWPGFKIDLDSSEDKTPGTLPYLDIFFNKYIRDQVNHASPLYTDLSKF